VGVAKRLGADDVLLVKNVTCDTKPNIHRHPSLYSMTPWFKAN
jgi:hypothetical protein